jgi:hypothetical protein
MMYLFIFLVILFVLYNFAEYKALKWAWKRGGLKGMLRMMVAILVRVFAGFFIRS